MNEKQKEAIEYLDNALIIAGAGTGKTTTIINKVNYLIENKIYKEEEILLISFTNESVNDIKKKLKNNVDVKTFHKLAIDILANQELHLCSKYLLDNIIDEYFNSYVNGKKMFRKVFLEKDKNSIKLLIKTFINLYKSNYANIDYLFNLYQKSHFIDKAYLKIIMDIYYIYQIELKSTNTLDFNDLIIKSTEYSKYSSYKYVIIDEFQDTSMIRFNLILKLLKINNGKLFAVGDDYQSIYRFNGCDLNIFLNINKYIPNIKIIKLEINYRNNQELIEVANSFIMKNKYQLKKNTICLRHNPKPIKIVFYVDKKEVINKITNLNDNTTLILGRYNSDLYSFGNYLTIHSAKGLESDNVILVSLENSIKGFPSKIKNDHLIKLIIPNEYIPFEEERRLFYVALTRAKNTVYLIVPKYNYSIFIYEIMHEYKQYIEYID